MKAFVTYEHDGQLVGLIVGPEDGPPVAIVTQPGQYVAELDMPKSLAELMRNGETDEEKIIKEVNAYRVEVKTEAKLVRKRSPSGKK
jgi:hypothetical protein